jgi:DNA primase
LNSPESDIYHKSQVLYGIYEAKKTIAKEDVCYLVEGYTDVIQLYQKGVENVVSSSGTGTDSRANSTDPKTYFQRCGFV